MSEQGNNDATACDHRRLPPLLRHAWYALNQCFRRRIAHLEITPDQFTILRWLFEHIDDGLTQRQMANLMSSDANTIASLLARMEAAGLVDRRQDEADRRANRVTLTAHGKRQFEQARDIAIELQTAVLEAVPPGQRDEFLRNLQRVGERTRALLEDT